VANGGVRWLQYPRFVQQFGKFDSATASQRIVRRLDNNQQIHKKENYNPALSAATISLCQ